MTSIPQPISRKQSGLCVEYSGNDRAFETNDGFVVVLLGKVLQDIFPVRSGSALCRRDRQLQSGPEPKNCFSMADDKISCGCKCLAKNYCTYN